jgi:hypothetical protein
MFAATAVAVVGKSTVKRTPPDVIVTPLTVTLSTEPAPPPVKVTLPVAATPTGVRLLTTELFVVESIVKRSTVDEPAEWQYCKLCCVKLLKPLEISVKYLLIERYPPIFLGNPR